MVWEGHGTLSHKTIYAMVYRDQRSCGDLHHFLRHPEEVLSYTYENGKGFAMHELLSEIMETQAYFAHPYHSWERGLNENTNGLIRQYFPKKTDFSTITQKHVNPR